jgi:hypothetical protein
MSKSIPVIVLNWNNAGDTVNCVESILGQTIKDCHVLLGDNGSEKEDVQRLSNTYSGHPRVKIISFDTNLGFTKAHNLLMAEAMKDEPEFIALLNNDAVAGPEWLVSLIRCSRETGAVMVSSKMISFYNPEVMDNAGHFMLNTGEIIPLGHGEPAVRYNERFYNMGPCAGACLYSAGMLSRIGFFDEYFVTGYEDAELGLRAIASGYTSVFEPAAVVHHKMGVSVKKVMDFEYLKKIQLNIFYTYLKIMPSGYILLNFPFLVFKFFAIVIIDLLFFRFRFLKMIVLSHSRFLSTHLKQSLSARKKFMQQIRRRRGTFFFLRKTMFFLSFDISRFFRYIIMRRKTIYEQ